MVDVSSLQLLNAKPVSRQTASLDILVKPGGFSHLLNVLYVAHANGERLSHLFT